MFESIQYNLDDIDIENRKKLYEKLSDGKRQLSIKVQTIIWYCAKMICVEQITSENYKEVYNRIFEYEEIYGTKAVRWEEVREGTFSKKTIKPIFYPIDEDDVYKLIGLIILPDLVLSNDEWKTKIKQMKEQLEKRTKEIEKSMKGVDTNNLRYADMKTISVVIPESGSSDNIEDVLPVKLGQDQNKSE